MIEIVEQRADADLSRRAIEENRWLFANRECFRNAALYAFGQNDTNYTEGFAISDLSVFPTHHAWCENSCGKVIELTPIWVEAVESARYFAAVRLGKDALWEMVHSGDAHYVFRNYREQFESAMKAAYIAFMGQEKADELFEGMWRDG